MVPEGRLSNLEFTGKWAGKEESDLPVSLEDGPPMVLLLTALVQPPAWYLCISSNYNQHTSLSIIPLKLAVIDKLHDQKCHQVISKSNRCQLQKQKSILKKVNNLKNNSIYD